VHASLHARTMNVASLARPCYFQCFDCRRFHTSRHSTSNTNKKAGMVFHLNRKQPRGQEAHGVIGAECQAEGPAPVLSSRPHYLGRYAVCSPRPFILSGPKPKVHHSRSTLHDLSVQEPKNPARLLPWAPLDQVMELPQRLSHEFHLECNTHHDPGTRYVWRTDG